MKRVQIAATVAALACAVAVGAAQKTTEIHPGKGGSPHVRTVWTIDGATITIEYGRPSLKGRSEAELMPPGQPWRTGADEPTTIMSDRALTFGAIKLEPKTTYAINTQPGAEWQIMFGKPGKWGIPYPKELEIGRTAMTVSKTKAPVEQLTISIDDTPAGGTLRIEWGTTSATIPFTVG